MDKEETFKEWLDKQGDNCNLIEAAWFDQKKKLDECNKLMSQKDADIKELQESVAELEKIKNME